MKYFLFHSHCYLIRGKVNDSLYDVFQNRIFWLNRSPYREIVRLLEAGKTIEEAAQIVNEGVENVNGFAAFLEGMDYGSSQKNVLYPEKFRPETFSGQEETFSFHRPIQRAVLEIATRCSLDCSICCSRNTKATALCACGVWKSGDDYKPVNWEKVVEELALCGCRHIYLQGGDPFLERETLYKLAGTAVRHGCMISVQTPAINLKDDDWKFIHAHRITLVVPIFGDNAMRHDTATGVPGSFKALEQVLEKGYPRLQVKIILNIDTLSHHEAIVQMLVSNNIHHYSTEYFLPHDDKSLHKRTANDFKVPMNTFLRLAKGHYCWQDEIACTHSGDILPCIAARHHCLGNIQKESLMDIMRFKRHVSYRDAGTTSRTSCNMCEFRYGCHFCTLMTERLEGSLHYPSWNCTYNPLSGQWRK